jgi:hypothetical protein
MPRLSRSHDDIDPLSDRPRRRFAAQRDSWPPRAAPDGAAPRLACPARWLAPAAVHHCRDRLDDEEEHRRRYGHELEEVGEERAVAKNGVVDREREVAEVWFPITIAITGVTMLLTKELMTAAKATPMTNATASSTMFSVNGIVLELMKHSIPGDERQ